MKLNERGFIFLEFVMALPILIFLMYAIGTLTLQIAKIAQEQVANYVIETEAQYVIDRITQDAKAAYSAEIKTRNGFDEIIFVCHANQPDKVNIYDILDKRIYDVDNAKGSLFHVYFKRTDDAEHNNPLTGENFFGNTFVTELKFSVPAEKVLHVTFEMQSKINNQKVKFSTAVYMSACKKIDNKGIVYRYE